MMHKTMKFFLFSAGLLSAGILGAQMPMRKAFVEVGTVVETEDFEARNYTGQVVSPSKVQIVPRVSGEILSVGFQDGALVKKGQMLYQLDPIQYQAAVKSCQAKIAEWKAKLEYAQNNFSRNDSLFKKKAASKDTMESTKAALEALRASLLAAEADLIRAQDDLKNTTITAPIAGKVGVTVYSKGNYVTPSSGVLVTIIQMQPLRVRFAISTADYLSMFGNFENLRKFASIRVTLPDGTVYHETGRIELLNNEANSSTDTIQIYAVFQNKDHKLIPGSTVRVQLSKKVGKKLPAVPPSAVMHDSKGSYVYVPDAKNQVSKRYVVAGNATGDLQMIRSGLKAGERVVTKGTHKTMDHGFIEPVAPQKAKGAK